jgi:hypothetical protein
LFSTYKYQGRERVRGWKKRKNGGKYREKRTEQEEGILG